MTIAKLLTPQRRDILRADIATLCASARDRGYMLAPWQRYYNGAKREAARAQLCTSERARRLHLGEAAVCLALALAARQRQRAAR